jgi:hypothetical protein
MGISAYTNRQYLVGKTAHKTSEPIDVKFGPVIKFRNHVTQPTKFRVDN